MEEVDTFDLIIHEYQQIENVYWAIFDVNTGIITGIYPNSSADNISNKIKIDKRIVESINNGEIHLSNCYANSDRTEVKVIETETLVKIDNVLHRITEKKWSAETDFDIYITYNTSKKTLKISMADYLGGTVKSAFSETKRKLNWVTDLKMMLIISDYNDPNLLYCLISLDLDDIAGKDKIIENIILPEYFSIYTKRLFKNYVMEII